MSAAASSLSKSDQVSRGNNLITQDVKQLQNDNIVVDSFLPKIILKTDCPVCGEKDRTKLQSCSRCRTVFYCTKEHQKLDYRVHKKLCIEIGKAQDPVEKQQLMEQLLTETLTRIPEGIY